MPQTEFQKNVAAILEVVMFENWLRFYFIAEEGDSLKIGLPAKSLERIRELYPNLAPLAEKMDGRPVDFEISRNSVLEHIINHIDGKTMPQGEAQRLLQSRVFQAQLQLFHTWEQLHEDQLDNGFQEFGAWKQLFGQWQETQGASELRDRLMGKKGCEKGS